MSSHQQPSTLAAALRSAVLLGAGLLLAPAFAATAPAAQGDVVVAKAHAKKPTAKKPAAKPAKAAAVQPPGPLADFGGQAAPADVTHVANWVSYTHNNQKKAFVVIDKKMARLYVFDPQGKLKSDSPILLGKAIGDKSAPGIGNKPMKQIKEDEKTTPAGRFLAIPAKNANNEDIIWIDYNAAVSMHRMRKVSVAEHRADRMATPDVSDNRISYGCVNVPPQFYNAVLSPTVRKYGAYVYVLPETMPPRQLFGSYDVPAAQKSVQVAQASPAVASRAGK